MEFTHFDKKGNARMVDVGEKEVTHRTAVATGTILVNEAVLSQIKAGTNQKGDVLGVARIAGIMGAKQTSQLIPLCHPVPLNTCRVDFAVGQGQVTCTCTAEVDGKTGVEMEALTGVQVALLTIYDMCKAVDRGMCITDVHLVTKTGGRSGAFTYEAR